MTFAKIAHVPMTLRIAGLVVLLAGLFLGLATESPEGRMTGGGSAFVSGGNAANPDGTRVTHGFELQCNVTKSPNNLEVNWEGNHFHLETITRATCTSFPPGSTCSAAPPNAPFHTYFGAGVGSLNGEPGATVSWQFTDCGEPGTKDVAEIYVRDTNGNLVLELRPAFLTFGNHQAHAANGKK
jgi:hypothetical protein